MGGGSAVLGGVAGEGEGDSTWARVAGASASAAAAAMIRGVFMGDGL